MLTEHEVKTVVEAMARPMLDALGRRSAAGTFRVVERWTHPPEYWRNLGPVNELILAGDG